MCFSFIEIKIKKFFEKNLKKVLDISLLRWYISQALKRPGQKPGERTRVYLVN